MICKPAFFGILENKGFKGRVRYMEKRNAKALLPIVVFVVLYLGLGMLFEYGLRLRWDFIKSLCRYIFDGIVCCMSAEPVTQIE